MGEANKLAPLIDLKQSPANIKSQLPPIGYGKERNYKTIIVTTTTFTNIYNNVRLQLYTSYNGATCRWCKFYDVMLCETNAEYTFTVAIDEITSIWPK